MSFCWTWNVPLNIEWPTHKHLSWSPPSKTAGYAIESQTSSEENCLWFQEHLRCYCATSSACLHLQTFILSHLLGFRFFKCCTYMFMKTVRLRAPERFWNLQVIYYLSCFLNSSWAIFLWPVPEVTDKIRMVDLELFCRHVLSKVLFRTEKKVSG